MLSAAKGKALKEKIKASGSLVDAGFGIVYAIGEEQGKVTLTAWKGKASRPFMWHIMKDEAHARSAVAQAVEKAQREAGEKAERGVREASKKAELVEKIEVGTILCCKWGYDQTNVDFYTVIEKKGQSVTVCKIAAVEVPGTRAAHDMGCVVRPDPNQYIGRPRKLRIGPYGVKVHLSYASPVAADSTHYCSWDR